VHEDEFTVRFSGVEGKFGAFVLAALARLVK